MKIYLKERDWFAGRYSGYKFSVGWKYIVLVRKPIKHILKKKKEKKEGSNSPTSNCLPVRHCISNAEHQWTFQAYLFRNCFNLRVKLFNSWKKRPGDCYACRSLALHLQKETSICSPKSWGSLGARGLGLARRAGADEVKGPGWRVDRSPRRLDRGFPEGKGDRGWDPGGGEGCQSNRVIDSGD